MNSMLFAFVATVGSVLAQSPLATSLVGDAAAWNGACVFFDLDVATTIAIDRLELNLDDSTGTRGSIEFCIGPVTWTNSASDANAWGRAAGGFVTSAGPDLATTCTLDRPVVLGPGRHGVALRHVDVAPRYSFASGASASFSTPEVTLIAGGITNIAFSGTALSPRVVNARLHYSLGGTPMQAASLGTYGQGCYATPGAFCERFDATRPFDLDNTTFRYVPNARGGYDVTRVQGPVLILPVGAAFPPADDRLNEAQLPWTFPFPGGSTNSIRICSNGYFWLQPSSVSDYTPTVAEFAAQPARFALAWTDFNPGAPGSGGVSYERDPLDRFVTITYDDVWLHGTYGTDLSTFQCVLFPNGEIEVRYGSVSHGSLPCIVGFTPGEQNLGASAALADFSTVSTMSTAFARPLQLTATQRPVVGATVSITTSNVPANALLTLNLIAFQQIAQGFDLAALGAAGCRQYVITNDADALFGTYTRTLGPIPADAIFLGLHVYSQSVSLVPGVNPVGALTSNGVEMVLGDI